MPSETYKQEDTIQFSKFKVGQYVMAKDGYRIKGVKPILEIKRDNIWEEYPDTDPHYVYSYLTEGCWSCENDLVAWEPKIGEYNFFYTKKMSLQIPIAPIFGRLIGIDEDGWYRVTVTDESFDEMEIYRYAMPFTGVLPQWLK